MRLTLRTLLAYLDDILEPSQTKEIGDKLNESSFASSLVSRIREVMRRRRLTAPTLTGPGVGIDPNTIAEYLDNTLPPDGVADVEKICLESDVHLAEAAACHQILTLALGEPVEVSSQTRERMYALGPAAAKMTVAEPAAKRHGSTNGASHDGLDEVLAQAPPAAAASQPRHATAAATPAKPTIPDYLRPRSSWKRMLAYAALAIVAIVWGTLTIKTNPFGGGTDKTKTADGPQVADAAGAGAGGNVADKEPGPAERATEEGDAALIAAAGNAGQSTGAELETPDSPTATVPADDGPGTEEPAPESARKGAKKVRGPAPEGVAGDENEPPEADEPPAPVFVQAPPSKYVSNEGVTLSFVPREERWYKLPPRSLVHADDVLAVPEPYQCGLEVDGGKGLVTIMGRSVAHTLAATEAGSFGIELRRGQFIVRPAGAGDDASEPLKIGIGIAGELWKAEIHSGAACGVQVSLLEPNKFEQALDKTAYIGAFYVDNGTVVVTDPAGHVFEIKGPGWLQLPLKIEGNTIPAQQPLRTLPKWMGPQAPSTTQQSYARKFETKFAPDEAVELTIPAAAADSNFNIARLATECLALVDAYGPLVEVLQSSPHQEARLAAISGIRLWLPRNPDNKDLLKGELGKRFPPEDAEIMYRLLWGYNQDDARDPKISEELIELMGNPERSIRELAFYHVQTLTQKTHEYRPDASYLKLRSALDAWRRHLKREGGALVAPQKPVPNPQ